VRPGFLAASSRCGNWTAASNRTPRRGRVLQAPATRPAKRFAGSHLANILGLLGRIVEASEIGYVEAAAAALRQDIDLGCLV
jgi:hypothetical protein